MGDTSCAIVEWISSWGEEMDKHKPIKSLVPEEVHQRAQQQHLKERQASEDLAKKNHNFVQVQRRNLKEFRRLIKENPTAAQLMFLFAEKMNRQNALMCSFKTLEDITGLSRSTLSKAISLLKKEQWIEVIKVGTANAYLINHSVFWQDSADKKNSHFIFGATIIASLSEQDDGAASKENWKGLEMRHFPFLHRANDEKDVTPIEQKEKGVDDDVDLRQQFLFGEDDDEAEVA